MAAARAEDQKMEEHPVDGAVQNVFDLLVASSRGEIESTAVESAVSQLLGKRQPTTTVDHDEDDYDNVDEPTKKKKKNAKRQRSENEEVIWSGPTVTLEELRKAEEDGDDPYDVIPMGKAGRQMLITFGDGPNPKPETVQAVLLGARRLLQLAIKDARAWRRFAKGEFATAKKAMHMGNKNIKTNKLPASVVTSTEAADPSLLFRSIEAHDKLGYDPKCGFDNEQLQQLFPEEMNAYNRWSAMHDEYQEKSKDSDIATVEASERDTKEGKNDQKLTAAADAGAGGHLVERASNFDIRTVEMKEDWYLKFAEVRRGSFLPRRTTGLQQDEKKWEKERTTTRGRKKDGSWDKMSIISIKFLHWVGFNPKSELPAPNPETTDALAFLAYDFAGKIVETAIRLRIYGGNVSTDLNDVGGEKVLPELPTGKQLEEGDITVALNDTSLRPVPLYSGDVSTQRSTAAQLYFGPGFERRIEMEMDELMESNKRNKRLTEEELRVRKQEDELFAKLAAPPKMFDAGSDIS